MWEATRLAVALTITLFIWAYRLDLLGTSPGENGALAVVGEAIGDLYQNTIGEAWLTAAVLLTGLWGIWRALVLRRYTETVGQLGASVLLVLVAMFFVLTPVQTISSIARPVSEMSAAFLTVTTSDAGDADPTQGAARRLHNVLIHDPWVVLEFGGTYHCATPQGDPRSPAGYADDGTPRAPEGARCIDNEKRYANRVLTKSGEDRSKELEKIAKGDDPYDEIDRPALDIQQPEGGYARLTIALLVLAASLGAVALLGTIAAALIISQLLVLFWLVFSPIMLVAAVYPGRGHALFIGWLQKLASSLIAIAIYSLILAIVLTLAHALHQATPALGWLMSFTLQGIFYWSILLYRRRIFELLTSAITGRDQIPMQRLPLMRSVAAGTLAHHAAQTLTRRRASRPAERTQGEYHPTPAHTTQNPPHADQAPASTSSRPREETAATVETPAAAPARSPQPTMTSRPGRVNQSERAAAGPEANASHASRDANAHTAPRSTSDKSRGAGQPPSATPTRPAAPRSTAPTPLRTPTPPDTSPAASAPHEPGSEL